MKKKKSGYNRRKVFAKRRKNPKMFILWRIKGGAKEQGREFNLTVEDIPDFPEYCPVFPWIKIEYKVGHELGRPKGKKDHMWGAPSIDRIDNSKGYVPGNIRFISFRANWLKGSATNQELIALGKDGLRSERLLKKAQSLSH